MQFPNLSSLDVKLIEPLYALLEERHVTRAAARCGMSQSAMSRAFERLRAAFDDELLVRSGGSYERTPTADRLLDDLQEILPRLDSALSGNRFDAATSRNVFRIATTDYGAAIFVPALVERLKRDAPRCRIEIEAWGATSADGLEAGRSHVGIIGSDFAPTFDSQVLFRDEFVCAVSRRHPIAETSVSLDRYLEYEHAVVSTVSGAQPWIEDALAAHGTSRRVGFKTPNHLSAMIAASRSDLICTTSGRIANLLATVADVRVLDAPPAFPKIVYHMVWHPRLRDDAAVTWLRTRILAVAAAL